MATWTRSVSLMRWAHADGIGFFAFDWYYNPDPGNGPINMAHDTYLKLRDHGHCRVR
jgi:hypothetical protein